MRVAGKAVLMLMVIFSLWGCCVPMHGMHDDDRGHEHNQKPDQHQLHDDDED